MDFSSIALFLFDIDGVFLAGKTRPRLVSGRRILPALRARGLPYRLVTNTSTHSCQHLAEQLRKVGVDVQAGEIHSALDATIRAAADRFPGGSCLVVGESGLADAAAAAGLGRVDEAPADIVIVGLTRHADYELLCRAARAILGGAALFGCHRNRLWLDDRGRRALSCGPWLAALEHATGAQAEVYGKPTTAFYRRACQDVGVEPAHALMVGDDPQADIAGAQAAGMKAALVLTGKTDRTAGEALDPPPDSIMTEVDDLVEMLPP